MGHHDLLGNASKTGGEIFDLLVVCGLLHGIFVHLEKDVMLHLLGVYFSLKLNLKKSAGPVLAETETTFMDGLETSGGESQSGGY